MFVFGISGNHSYFLSFFSNGYGASIGGTGYGRDSRTASSGNGWNEKEDDWGGREKVLYLIANILALILKDLNWGHE